ncbi:MAG: hypothetical protein K0R27_279 [Xanthobacteraceae bacterium]|jgi:hypothetical protein|nr:hypothetical protein [Xanthobacteraceae bacterium]
MNPRKQDLRLPSRTPAYVSREVGAAEIGVSPATWDNWVRDGRLPPAAPGFPDGTPRWRWADVDRRLSGTRPAAVIVDEVAAGAEDEEDEFVKRAAAFKTHGKTAKRAGQRHHRSA